MSMVARSPVMMMVVIVWWVWIVRIPVAAPIAYSPPYGIPTSVVVWTIPGIIIPRIPEPRVVNVGHSVPIPWVIVMAAMEAC